MPVQPLPYLPAIHSCPDCWTNGGPGHHLDQVTDSFGVVRWVAGPAKTTACRREPEPQRDRRSLWWGQPPRPGVVF